MDLDEPADLGDLDILEGKVKAGKVNNVHCSLLADDYRRQL